MHLMVIDKYSFLYWLTIMNVTVVSPFCFHCSCGLIKKDTNSDEFSVIVVAGTSNEARRSVQILDEGATEWRSGVDFPHLAFGASLVTDRHGGVVVIGGVSSSVGPLDTLYHLPHANADAWTLMDQKLPEPTGLPFSFLVSDDVCQPI